jgi:FkbM family methyltransferase
MHILLNKLLHSFLPERKIWELKNRSNIPSMEWSLQNIKSLGFYPNFAIGVGAFDGEWTSMFKSIFPVANVLMLEAQETKKTILENLTKDLEGVSSHISLLGSEAGKDVVFHINETVSSVFAEHKENNFRKEVYKTDTLDNIVAKISGEMKPDFIKLDVQGSELEVLKGAANTLENVQFILCEVSLIEINKGAPLIGDVIAFMKANSFVCYDICSVVRRPLDRALWQTDILFVRESNPVCKNKNWN